MAPSITYFHIYEKHMEFKTVVDVAFLAEFNH